MDHQLLGNLESSAMTEELQRDTRQWTPLAVMDHQLLGNLESSAVTEGLQRDTRQWTPLRSSDITLGKRRIPPKVPKRTSSVTIREFKDQANMINSCAKSVQSSTLCSNSGEGCEMTRPNIQYIEHSKGEIGKVPNKKSSPEPPSPVWKRKSRAMAEEQPPGAQLEDKRTNNLSENNTHLGGFDYSTPLPISVLETVECPPEEAHTLGCRTPHDTRSVFHPYKISEAHRKRQYRVGLNLFNKKPEKGIQYLIGHNYLEASPKAVAHFLISRKGLGKQSIGEYLGNLQHPFNMAVLECFVEEMDLAGMQVDVALRKFQTFFRMPGEAQKIERLVEAFSHHYIKCNQEIISKLHNPETIFVLAFAIIMLNTDLHTPSMRAEKRMKLEDFIKNVQGVDDGNDLDRDMLTGVYQRIKASEFKPGFDHVSQVMKLQQTIVGKKQNLALPHRRLVCYCRLYEVYDINKKERPGLHQREVFLFNDMIMITKVFNKKKNSVAYTFRQSFPLCGLNVTLFETSYYPWGIRLCQRVDDNVVITLNARNGQDRSKFVDDLKESILEMDEMENMRIEAELKKQTSVRNRCSENRDSGVADVEIVFTSSKETLRVASSPSTKLNHSHLSNSLLDLYDYQIKPARRGSAGSLDSGMSISFSSSTTSTLSQGSVPQKIPINRTTTTTMNSINKSSQNTGFFGSLFGKKGKTSNRSKVY
ncbi:IQ motif and SEC7 domain-containing protein 1-like [Limulus polyphemus]|uniref:IQ motif and SEC7 domain-containing protein 1-like n=1 Tax=Limulus polyphemus TaxID=6850 RepID=A0ABM1BWV8_LIMPO|nr:IQ motif and SEC7 domain-containing protein 1-like [Limulus polyphemus]